MARAKREERPDPLAPYLTQHSADPDWPVTIVVDERGQSRHGCADCGEEIVDGARVERDPDGRVLAYSPSHETVEAGGVGDDGQLRALRTIVETDRTVHHHCGRRRG